LKKVRPFFNKSGKSLAPDFPGPVNFFWPFLCFAAEISALGNNVWVINASRYQNEFILQLRNRENIYIPFARLTTTSQPFVNLPKTWCQFPNGKIKILRNKLEVKVELTQIRTG
jgi:hypothetical protein